MEPLFRRLAFVAGLAAFLWVTWRVFGDPPTVPGGTATAYATLCGAGLAAVWGFYKWSKERDR